MITYEEVARRIEDVTVRACWRQWRALQGGGIARGESPARSITDPEGLLLASLALRDKEQRLRDLLYWWVQHGAHLLSVQRLNTLTKEFPRAMVQSGVEWFASMAVDSGAHRWKRLASAGGHDERARPGKGPKKLHLLEPSTLLLRLRAGFGVGAKADLMAFLIGAHATMGEREIWTTIHVMSKATSYSRASVARAASEMCLAGFVEQTADRPPMYALELMPWARVLKLRNPLQQSSVLDAGGEDEFDIPRWRFWAQVFAFLIGCLHWAKEAEQHETAQVVQASRARDLVDRFGRYIVWNGVDLPDARLYAGERYLSPFCELVERVLNRVDSDT